MTDLIKIDSNVPEDVLRIELFLSNFCNYKCWYCFPGSNEGTHRWPNLEPLMSNLSFLLNHYKNNAMKKRFHLHIIGGEPTLWKDLEIFIKHFKENYNCKITTSTNASRTLRWWDEHGQHFDEVLLSCHHQYVDIEHTIEVANILYKKNVWVTAVVLMDPDAWEKCIKIVDKLKSKVKCPISVAEIQHSTINYTQEQKKYISSNAKKIPNLWYFLKSKRPIHKNPKVYFTDGSSKTVRNNWLSLNRLNKFYGWQCNIGVDTVYIEKNGVISGTCGEFLYNLDFKFNIFDINFKDKFYPTIVPTICHKEYCKCQPEINCRKEKNIISTSTSTAEYPLRKYTSLEYKLQVQKES
jgi:organic radical activating enzyme